MTGKELSDPVAMMVERTSREALTRKLEALKQQTERVKNALQGVENNGANDNEAEELSPLKGEISPETLERYEDLAADFLWKLGIPKGEDDEEAVYLAILRGLCLTADEGLPQKLLVDFYPRLVSGGKMRAHEARMLNKVVIETLQKTWMSTWGDQQGERYLFWKNFSRKGSVAPSYFFSRAGNHLAGQRNERLLSQEALGLDQGASSQEETRPA